MLNAKRGTNWNVDTFTGNLDLKPLAVFYRICKPTELCHEICAWIRFLYISLRFRFHFAHLTFRQNIFAA